MTEAWGVQTWAVPLLHPHSRTWHACLLGETLGLRLLSPGWQLGREEWGAGSGSLVWGHRHPSPKHLVAQRVKSPPAVQETWVRSPGQEDPLEKGMPATPVSWPGESHEQRSLACGSPWGRKESDTTERPTL